MFGQAKGLDFSAFCKAVKRLALVTLQPEGFVRIELPLNCYNVPIYAFVIERKECR